MSVWATTYRSDFGVSAQSNAEAHGEASVAPPSLPSLQPFILAIEAAEIRLLKKGTPAFMLKTRPSLYSARISSGWN